MIGKDWLFDRGVDTFKQKAVLAGLRWILTGTGFVIASKSDNADLEQLAAVIVTGSTLLWSFYEKWQEDRKQKNAKLVTVTALGLAQKTENQVQAMVNDPTIQTPSPFTPPDVIPTLSLSDVERWTRPA